MMQTTMMRVAVSGMLLLAITSVRQAEAARAAALRLGAPRITKEGVAVPVHLVAHRSSAVAALNFDLRYDPSALAVRVVTPGPAVTAAGAQLSSRADGGVLRALVVPAFRPDMPALRGRVATVQLAVRGGPQRGLGRWLRQRIHLERVVLGDVTGHELRPATRKGH